MSPLEQEANRAFFELVSAFEQFRQAWERAMMARQTTPAEPPMYTPPPQSTAPQKLLTRREAAEYLGVRPETLAVWHCTGRYKLPVVKIGRSTRYRLSDLERWLTQRTQGKLMD